MDLGRKLPYKKRQDTGVFSLTSTFAGKAGKLQTLFIFIWFVVPAILLNTAPLRSDDLFPTEKSATIQGDAGLAAPPQFQAPTGGNPSAPSVVVGSVPGSNPSDGIAPGAGAKPQIAKPPPAKPAAPAGNPAGAIPDPQKREQVLYNVYADPGKKVMVCLAPRATLYPLQSALTKIAKLKRFSDLSPQEKESVFTASGYKRIAFVRNPSARLHAVYVDKFVKKDASSEGYKLFMQHLKGADFVRNNDVSKLPRLTFVEFLKQVKENGFDGDEVWDSINVICGMDKVQYDFILHSESYVADATKLLNGLGLSRIPHAVFDITEFKSETNGIGDKINQEAIDILASLYTADYDKLGYTRGGRDFIRAPASQVSVLQL
mmetsp:Transcript_30281/g.116151  ORF Transcript_30281/g.116151 Transcript_30281/m.116151 type:complete len:375 (-) Transcript_30281:674-1798(-)|eukprot:CAMPEP_0113966092 /NCGR_PEP_ID=MMETSP0011_2-20120614/8130_1 /TAXON_ID=101924 /ORGANISM="Rhodosorus marinus" /LENGTH=374 /DNA_ID=CAMNT_0000978721 /DNA_START=153 /DNA_END=1277 /DNA_ORIENTATION=+ /assembly_acc=CAM_ASM_000156